MTSPGRQNGTDQGGSAPLQTGHDAQNGRDLSRRKVKPVTAGRNGYIGRRKGAIDPR